MRKKITQTMKISGLCCGVLCIVALAAFALFASCERPEPELEPPTPPVVDPDTLPTNKFIGTWVLCAMNDVNSEPPATCDLADATTDTLVFVDDSTLIQHRGTDYYEYIYEFSENYLVCYWPEAGDQPERICADLYYFREDDQELVLRGYFFRIGILKNFCLKRITQK